jgi:hypothetical protein
MGVIQIMAITVAVIRMVAILLLEAMVVDTKSYPHLLLQNATLWVAFLLP